MKESEDENFWYVFTWLEGEHQKGWTTHYRPKHLPISPEVRVAFDFMGLAQFTQCPEFDFEPCLWRLTPFEKHGNSFFDGNADVAHRWFDAHAEHFSPGLEQLLTARGAMQRYGMAIWDVQEIPVPQLSIRGQGKSVFLSKGARRQTARPYTYDVAISFAGTERPLAERLAQKVRTAGFEVFYDDFYPEQLWGKDLVTHFDNIYRKESRYCVMLISREYAERMWPDHERRSAQARAVEEKGREYILPVNIDDTELDGMAPTLGYLDIKRHTVEQIAELLIKKLQID
jgi:hypothetical protein